ncbi:MAG: hypothetical protein PUF32_02295 [Prevotella sp.]|nr:hypothetical protein [Prevotella sp.]
MEIISSTDALAIVCQGENYDNVEDMTIPDQCLSVTEILERFTSGTYTPEYRQGVYDEDDADNLDTDVDVLERPDVDLVDVQEAIEASNDRLSKLQQLKNKLNQQKDDANASSANEANERSDKSAISTSGVSTNISNKDE